MVKTSKHPNINLFSYSEVIGFGGVPGNYNATIYKKPRYINEDKCTGCGLCSTKCPVRAPNEFDRGLGERSAIYISFPQAVPKIALIDRDLCIECKNCQRSCMAKAIDFDQKPEYIHIKIGCVIVATGWEEYPIIKTNEYNYGIFPNVITQIELERMLSPIGPTGGHICRISDGKIPKKVAMIQCVGSRTLNGNPYCSFVCCGVALKNAQLLKQEYPDMEIIIFYIDIRTSDKGNEEYFRKVRESGIIMVRGMVGSIKEDSNTKNLKIVAESSQSNDFLKIDVDLVVLSTGIVPSRENNEIIDTLSISKGPSGFLSEIHGCLKPQETKSAGIYICGCASGPKNIPYSVSSALAAACKVATLISSGKMHQELMIVEINEEFCMGCHRCEKTCYFNAIKVNEEDIAVVDELKCRGCGVCVTLCPARAIDLKYYREKQLSEEIKGISHIRPKFSIEEVKLQEKEVDISLPHHKVKL